MSKHEHRPNISGGVGGRNVPADILAEVAKVDANHLTHQQAISAANELRKQFVDAWNAVRYFTRDTANGLSQDEFWAAWADQFVSLGAVLKELGLDRHLDSMTFGDDPDALPQAYALKVFRAAVRGDRKDVTALISRVLSDGQTKESFAFRQAVNESLRRTLMERVSQELGFSSASENVVEEIAPSDYATAQDYLDAMRSTAAERMMRDAERNEQERQAAFERCLSSIGEVPSADDVERIRHFFIRLPHRTEDHERLLVAWEELAEGAFSVDPILDNRNGGNWKTWKEIQKWAKKESLRELNRESGNVDLADGKADGALVDDPSAPIGEDTTISASCIPSELGYLGLVVDEETRIVRRGDAFIELTEGQFQLFKPMFKAGENGAKEVAVRGSYKGDWEHVRKQKNLLKNKLAKLGLTIPNRQWRIVERSQNVSKK